jgi:hypothetical protein
LINQYQLSFGTRKSFTQGIHNQYSGRFPKSLGVFLQISLKDLDGFDFIGCGWRTKGAPDGVHRDLAHADNETMTQAVVNAALEISRSFFQLTVSLQHAAGVFGAHDGVRKT